MEQTLKSWSPIIPKSTAGDHWSETLRHAIRDPLQLCDRLGLDPDQLPGGRQGLQQGHGLFRTLVPEPFLQLMEPGNPQDPLLLQVLPLGSENQPQPGFVTDPLQEQQANPLPGLIHKYTSRVLLTTSGACAVNCRYCFRRHFPYADNSLSEAATEQIIHYLQQHPQVNEIILSGGDPLATPDARLAKRIRQLEQLPQLKRLRIHTRLPVVIPSRINDELLTWLSATRLQTLMVLHINHPQEISPELEKALARLHQRGVILLNQSVLLRGVNDNPVTLGNLSERLFEQKVMPYYLHAFDPVAGAAHFAIDDQQAKRIYQQLLARLPGYLVPRLVREQPDQPSKTPLGW
ncbi:EF-P beta-lysylation protein EpmB [Marinospirillum alkaliphilum]|uniref:L-lysine 2,3-aminomutase n=1 Tax=Marinospirillum alkaliphilum DSM 21637 TaxID=1122209 RepID=A0A1K1V8Q6_9GAMM|nr:EF-P beta-lysylation protein EpmB [Marinospirillum alkaliphilum]SFX21123.1 L-lysine 2,3-aminomutase [Marinospirillum alkaliphilum DSM 21637]